MSLTPVKTDFALYELDEKEQLRAKLLSPEQRAVYQHRQTELTETIAEFQFSISSSGQIVNQMDLGQLRGARQVLLQILQDDREARQQIHDDAVAAANQQVPHQPV